MEWYWLITLMLFAHIIADFHIQGILAELKQRSNWLRENPMYHYDYIPSLICHAFEWSVITHIPAMWFIGFEPIVFISIMVNAVIHYHVDSLKCNERRYNLIQDQLCHFAQVVISAIVISLIG